MNRVLQIICSLVITILLVLSSAVPAFAVSGSFTVPLTISNVTTLGTSDTEASIYWKTSDTASSQVYYDTVSHADIASYLRHSVVNNNQVTLHNVYLTGLLPSTTYHYRVKSVKIINSVSYIAISGDYTLTTQPAPVTTTTPATTPTTTSATTTTTTATTTPTGTTTTTTTATATTSATVTTTVTTTATTPPVTTTPPTATITTTGEDFEVVLAEINKEQEAIATDKSGNRLGVTGNIITLSQKNQVLTVDIPVALAAGASLGSFTDATGITYENNTLEIPGHATSPGGKNLLEIVDTNGDLGTTLIINTAEAVGDGEKAVAEVLSIRTRSGYTVKDFTAENPEIGEVASSVCLELNTLPENARVIITTVLEPDPAARSAFQLVAKNSGLGDINIAYTINVEKINIANGTHIHCATITMVVSQEWVAANGGNDAIRIIRYDEQNNEPQILNTTFVGYDTQNRAVFEGFSPGGLSIFALVGTIAQTETLDQNKKLNDFQTRVITIFSVIGGLALFFWFFLLFKKRRRGSSDSE